MPNLLSGRREHGDEAKFGLCIVAHRRFDQQSPLLREFDDDAARIHVIGHATDMAGLSRRSSRFDSPPEVRISVSSIAFGDMRQGVPWMRSFASTAKLRY